MASTLRGSDNFDTANALRSQFVGPFATSSGTLIDVPNVPSWARRTTIFFKRVSTGGSANFVQVLLGYGATPTYVSTGYEEQFVTTGAGTMGTALATTGFNAINPSAASIVASGSMVLTHAGGNDYIVSGSCAESTGTRMYVFSGMLSLGALLTALRFQAVDGFDAGSVSVLYEG